jgi:dolichol-phosphate mannosyltransferase
LISGAIAIELSFIFNFFINMAWTFEDVEFKNLTGVLMALLRDHGVRSVGMGVNLLLLWLFTDVLGIYYLLSQLIGAGIVAVWNFAGNILWTWDE